MFDSSAAILILTLVYFLHVFSDYKRQYTLFNLTNIELTKLKDKFIRISNLYRKIIRDNTCLKSEIRLLEKELKLKQSRLENEIWLRKRLEAKCGDMTEE